MGISLCLDRRFVLAAALSVLVLDLLAPTALGQQFDGNLVRGTQDFAFAGQATASSFDVDGDRVEDIAVGHPYFSSAGWTENGKVELYSGATRALLLTLEGGTGFEHLGTSIALLNDLDGDGFGELCVGSPGWNGFAGAVTMFSGLTGAPLWSVTGGTGALLGFSVAAAGDVDGDRKGDVVVGAPGIDTVYVFGWGAGAIHTLKGQGGSSFGRSVAGNFDIDGDKVADFIVGQPNYTTTFPSTVTNRGRMAAYSGKTGAEIFSAFGDDAYDYFGWTVCGMRDVDGDFAAEVVVGAPFDDDLGSNSGLVRVFRSTGAVYYDLRGDPDSYFGRAICAVPDMTGDGEADLAVGATGGNGAVHLVSGPDGTDLYTILPPDLSYASFGWSISTGDYDGDGLWDLVIGDPDRNDGTLTWAGSVDLYRAAPAFTESYGAGWPGTFGIPSLGCTDPVIGANLTLSIANSRGALTPGFLFIGFQRISVPTSAGGTLLVLPTYMLRLLLPAAGLDLQSGLADDPSLLGVEVDLQVLEIDPGASKGLSFTPGLALSIGIDTP